ncbi:MAG TPA: rhodanese-like domain-containing protein [Solirubrobacteraceae bacterium]|nr:rhodanese-like domain-containing protein [Solirubrobacteraceae bacterium]
MSENPLMDPEIEVTPQQTKELLDSGEAIVVDVREPYEREAGHIEGSRHIELERLSSQAATLPKDQKIVFHCRLGARSAMAAQAFRASGFDAWSMEGGLQKWADEGLQVDGGGEVADH